MKYQSNKEAEAARKHELLLEAAVRALPDSVVDGDEEIQSIKSRLDPMLGHLQRMRGLRSNLERLQTRIAMQLNQTRGAMKRAALDDALAGEFEFPRYAAVAQRVMELEDQMEAAKLAERASAEPSPYADTLASLHKALADTTRQRKREHVEAHPELLKAHG